MYERRITSINRQRSRQGGFIYVVAGLAVALLFSLGGNAFLWQRINVVKLEAKNFRAEVAANGELAKLNKEKTDFWNSENLRIANEKLKTALAHNAVTIKQLRTLSDARAAERRLPEPPKESSRPDLLCLDRETFQRERRRILDRFRKRIRSIADRCSKDSMKFKALCEWSKKIQ